MIIQSGLDQFEKKWPRELTGMRIGLLVHPASVNSRIQHAIDLVSRSKKVCLTALFGPQHGLRGETQDNMVEWEGFVEERKGLPVFSLYGHTRKPEPSMLEDVDAMVIDLQDVGARYYTFIWTMDLCMEICRDMNKSVVILDRPNPVNGASTEGPVLDPEYASFVGQRPLPVRHGMTMGEIGNYLCHEYYPSLNFHVIPLRGWRRSMWFEDSGLPWVMPSPNMPTLHTATVYPGMCLLEGTNVSEGRGTTRPFEVFGAPFIDPEGLARRLNAFKLPGIFFRPLYFQPTFQKHEGKLCGGAQIHIMDRRKFKPFKTGVAVLKTVHDLYPEEFAWKEPPYEYEDVKLPIDILAGTERMRKGIEKGEELEHMEQWWNEQCRAFQRKTRRIYLIYE
jgi:uncharacterized protein YbbC (DUF1343 family)